MVHVIVFAYIFTILIGASAFTVQWLADKGRQEKSFTAMKPFIVMLLLMNLYDFVIYYSGNVMRYANANLLISVGDGLIAVLVFFWLRACAEVCGLPQDSRYIRAAGRYLIVYMAVWFVSIAFFREQYWVRLIVDVPLFLLLLAGGASYISSAAKKSGQKNLILYITVITLFIGANYITYYISETGLVSDPHEGLMNITIFFWLIINAANMVLLYKRDFSRRYLEAQNASDVMPVEEALAAVRKKFALTKRETEILAQLYEGKSNTQIAELLFISESTVKAHIYNLFRKMDIKSRGEAVRIVRDMRNL